MSAKTKSQRLKRLVSHGYFAPELPPCFVSDDLARYRKSILDGVDSLAPIQNRPAFHRFTSEPSWFYFPRFGKEDRRHGVPNPISHLLLSRAIADNYVALRRRARASKITLSPVVFDWVGARALVRNSVDLRDHFRVKLSSRREEYATADVRAFFHSIYTHAVPWAIYGKAWAKQNRGTNHYGNLIDLLCRNSQDGQTIGLPVGPDTSRLLAEVLASAVDEAIQSKLGIGKTDASRYIDDFTLSGGSDLTSERLIAALRLSMSDFELELNAEKSGVFSTAHRHSIGWQHAVREIMSVRPYTDDATHRFFYKLGNLCAAHPDINVEKFGLQNARSAVIGAQDWDEVFPILVNSYRRNPSLVAILVELCILRHSASGDATTNELREFLENRLPALALANRSGELIWLLFLAARLSIRMQSNALKPLFELENAFVALLISYLDSQGLIEGQPDQTVWNRSLNQAGLRSPMWLYAYEAAVRGWIPNVGMEFIENDDYFSLLSARRVRFFDPGRGFTSISSTLRSLRDSNGRLQRLREAIEARHALDYEDFDDEEQDFDDLDLDDDDWEY